MIDRDGTLGHHSFVTFNVLHIYQAAKRSLELALSYDKTTISIASTVYAKVCGVRGFQQYLLLGSSRTSPSHWAIYTPWPSERFSPVHMWGIMKSAFCIKTSAYDCFFVLDESLAYVCVLKMSDLRRLKLSTTFSTFLTRRLYDWWICRTLAGWRPTIRLAN